MTRYDLSPFRRMPVVRLLNALRWVLRCVTLLVILGLVWSLVTGPALTGERVAGFALLFFIFGLGGFAGFASTPQATSLTVGTEGIFLEYGRSSSLVGRWDDPNVVLRGMRTDGVKDYTSRGKPLHSIWGRWKGLTESYIPHEAFEEVLQLAKEHGLRMEEVPIRRGWLRYTLKR